jgi:hypothetical protein
VLLASGEAIIIDVSLVFTHVRPILMTMMAFVDESVREAFVTELVPIMWWFYAVRMIFYPLLFLSISNATRLTGLNLYDLHGCLVRSGH